MARPIEVRIEGSPSQQFIEERCTATPPHTGIATHDVTSSISVTTVAAHPTIAKAWINSIYRTAVIEGGATRGIDVEVVRRDPTTRGFAPLPWRWAVERTFDWLMVHRRLARDYEALWARSAAMIDLMARRLTGESTPTWRGTGTRIRRNLQDEMLSYEHVGALMILIGQFDLLRAGIGEVDGKCNSAVQNQKASCP